MKFNKKLILIPALISYIYAYNVQEDIQKGKDYLKQNNTNLAIASFERVLMYEPQNDEVKVYLAKIFEKTNPDLSKKYLNSIKKEDKKIKQKIEKIENQKGELKFDIFVKVGAVLDTNINNDTNENEWIVNSKKVYQNTHQESALGIYELLSIAPTYTINNTPITNQFTIYNKNVIKYTDKNIQLLNYTPSLSQKFSMFNFRHHLGVDYIRYSNEHYLNRYSIGESINFKFLKKNKSITNLKFTLNKYAKDDTKNYSEFSIDTKLISNILDSLNLSANLEYKTASSDKGYIQNDYNSFKLGIGSKISISKYEVELNANYKTKNYNKLNTLFNKKQEDKIANYKISFNSKGFFTYQTEVEYINNKSNIKPYSYDKWLISVNLIKTFKGL